MQSKNFSIKQAFQFALTSISSWHNFSRLVPVLMLSNAVGLIWGLIGPGPLQKPAEILQFLRNHYMALVLYILITILVSCFVSALTMKMSLGIYDSGKATLMGSLLAIKGIAFNYVLLCLMMMLIMMGGLLLFVVPGIIFLLFYIFAPMILIEKEMGVFEALRESKLLGAGIRMKLFALFITWAAMGIACGWVSSYIGAGSVVSVILNLIIIGAVSAISLLTLIFTYRSLQRK